MRLENVELVEKFSSQWRAAVDKCMIDLHPLKERLKKLSDNQQQMLSINPQESTMKKKDIFTEMIACSHYIFILEVMQNSANIESITQSTLGLIDINIDELWNMVLNKIKKTQSEMMGKLLEHIMLRAKNKSTLEIVQSEINLISSAIEKYPKTQHDTESVILNAQKLYLKKIQSFCDEIVKFKSLDSLVMYILNEILNCSKSIICSLKSLKSTDYDYDCIIKHIENSQLIANFLGDYSNLQTKGMMADDVLTRKTVQYNFKCLEVIKIIKDFMWEVNFDISKYMGEFYLAIGFCNDISWNNILATDEVNKIKGFLYDSVILQIFTSAIMISAETLYDDYFLAITDTKLRLEYLESLFRNIFSDGVDLNNPFYILAENFCIDNIYTQESVLLQNVLNTYIAPHVDYNTENESQTYRCNM